MMPDKDLINSKSRQDVVKIIRDGGRIGRAEIARIVGLSIPTIMKISSDLVSMGLIREVGKGESSGGKPPKLLEFVPDTFYSVGLDIGTNNLTCVITDCAASIVHKTVWPTNRRMLDRMNDRMCDCIQTTLDNAGLEREKILGIGLAMPGLIDFETGRIIFSPNFNLVDVDIVAPVRERFGLPVRIENVTRAMAFGEKNFGLCRNVGNFLCVNLGYGIGSAVVIDGQLYRGSSSTAGELGHITIKPHGTRCECGKRGCLEAVASANAIARDAKARLAAGEQSLVGELVEGEIEAVSTKLIFEAAHSGDALALEIVDEAIDCLAIGLASMTTMFDPELVVLEGGMSRMGAPFIDRVSALHDDYKMNHCGKHTRIVISRFGEDAAAIGAASIVLNSFFSHDGAALAVNY